MLMVTEPERLELHQAMRGLIGTGPANTFMELTAPRDWDQIVRVHQLDAAINGSRSELREETAGLKAELKQDMAELKAELKHDMSELKAELKQDMAELKLELKLDIAQLRTEFTALLTSELRSQTKWIIGVLSTLCVALIVAVVR